MSVRPWVMPATVALTAAGLTAVAPALAPAPPAPVPIVHVQDIALAGIGQDIYNAITPTVQYVVGGGSYLVNFIPIIGGPIAAQININYFQLIQPTVAATVNYLAGVVQDPVNIIPTTQSYGVTLYDIGYNYVSAQLQFLGQSPLPPLPPIAASRAIPGKGMRANKVAPAMTTADRSSARAASSTRQRTSVKAAASVTAEHQDRGAARGRANR